MTPSPSVSDSIPAAEAPHPGRSVNPYGFAILIGLNRTGKHVYAGTADPKAVAKRRAARKARRSTLQSQRKASK